MLIIAVKGGRCLNFNPKRPKCFCDPGRKTLSKKMVEEKTQPTLEIGINKMS